MRERVESYLEEQGFNLLFSMFLYHSHFLNKHTMLFPLKKGGIIIFLMIPSQRSLGLTQTW
jgi:hypothetical protein